MLRRLFLAALPSSLAGLVSLPKRAMTDRGISIDLAATSTADRPVWGRIIGYPTSDPAKFISVGLMFIPAEEWEGRPEAKDPRWKKTICPFRRDYLLVIRATDEEFSMQPKT